MRVEPNKLFLKITRPEHIQRESENFENILKSFISKGATTKNKDQSNISALIVKYGIPKEIITAIISVESSFNPMAYNKNKDGTEDRGLMQVNYQHNLALMREYGIIHPNQLYNPEINIELGARILYENYKRFGNWVMAIKAYNGLNANNWDYVKKVFEKIAEFKLSHCMKKYMSHPVIAT